MGSVTHRLKSLNKKTLQTKLPCHMHLMKPLKTHVVFFSRGGVCVKLLNLCHHLCAPLLGYLDVSLMSPSHLLSHSLLVLAGSIKTRNCLS